jgi:drug/metabolite transporter (DMT)-like permease
VRTLLFTAVAMLAFAGNSLLCRLALKHTAIDPATFTTIRLLSGAIALWLIVQLRRDPAATGRGSWGSALALVAYAACFSFAYVELPAAAGALLLFGAVQATMIGTGLWRGERLGPLEWVGLAIALAGLAGLLLPGLSAPPWGGSLLMLAAGVAWGVYSLRGRGAGDPTRVTAGNFLLALPFALLLSALMAREAVADPAGIAYAVASGALASGVGYAVWYTALRGLNATRASVVQLSVPAITALGGALFIGEAITARLVLASAAILGGVALVIVQRGRRA